MGKQYEELDEDIYYFDEDEYYFDEDDGEEMIAEEPEEEKPVMTVKKPVSHKKAALKQNKHSGKKMSRKRNHNGRNTGFWHKVKTMDMIDRVVAVTGVFIMVFAIVTGTMYVKAKTLDKQVASFSEVGTSMEGIEIIGESGLLAMADVHASMSASAAQEDESVPMDYEEKELFGKGSVKVAMHLNSMQKDLKIKFVNEKTGKLVANVPFTVNVTGADKKTFTLKDEDKDGIIYQGDMAPGKCSVSMEEVKDAEEYSISTESITVTIKDKIEYKKVDVSDEVKKESEVNVAAEDTKKQNTVEESALTNTVDWVEASKTPASGTEVVEESGYEEVPKDKITDPATLVSASRFMRFAAAPEGGEVILIPEGRLESGEFTTSEDTSLPDATTVPDNVPPAEGTVTPDEREPADRNVLTEIKVSLDRTEATLQTGENFGLAAVTEPAGNSVEWSSSDAQTASVDNGKVTALKAGSADITAKTSTGHTSVCRVTVTDPGEVNQKPVISISASSVKLFTEKTQQLTAEVKNAEDKSVIWSSDHPEIASVTADGVVAGISEGAAVVTAVSNGDKTVSVTCSVTVRANPEKDSATRLKDNEGCQLFVKDSEGKYREAVYSDYYTAEKFYKTTQNTQNTDYKYTGWQTIDGKTYYYEADGNKVTGEQIIQGAKYNFDSEGVLAAASGNLGIDVSKWNGNIDWNAVKNSGVSYVIIRCGYRGSTTGALIEDPKFRSNIQGATAAGLKVGVYFFTQAVNEVEAVEEASMVAGLVSGYKISYPIFLDVEPSGGRADSISAEARTNVCKAFCQTIQNSGYTAGIYANTTWLTSFIHTGSLTNYKIWLAQYAAAPTYKATRYDLWQYSAKGSVAGIQGNVDMNISYLGY